MTSKEEFQGGLALVCKRLNLKRVKTEILASEEDAEGFQRNALISHRGGFITIDAYSEYEVEFGKKERHQVIRYALYFQNSFGIYNYISDQSYAPNEAPTFTEWLTRTLKDFDKWKANNELAFSFSDRPIYIMGNETSNMSFISFNITLQGFATACSPKKILIYRIKHFRRGVEIYSYAIFIDFRHAIYDYSYWAIFPKYCGGGGGCGEGARIQTEKSIEALRSRGIDVQVVDLDIDEEEFDKFLEGYKNAASTNGYRTELLYNTFSWRGLPHNFEIEYQRILDEIKHRDLGRALRDMRGLFEELSKFVLSISREERLDRKQIAQKFISSGKFSKEIEEWIDAFYTYSNPQAHRIPDKIKVGSPNEEILYLTLCIGKKLINDVLSKYDSNS